MFFGHRFAVALEWVFEEVWEAKNLNFGSFFEQKSKAKKHDVLEGPMKPSRRGKKQSPERLRKWGGARVETCRAQLACWGGRGGITKNQQLIILHALGPLARRIFRFVSFVSFRFRFVFVSICSLTSQCAALF